MTTRRGDPPVRVFALYTRRGDDHHTSRTGRNARWSAWESRLPNRRRDSHRGSPSPRFSWARTPTRARCRGTVDTSNLKSNGAAPAARRAGERLDQFPRPHSGRPEGQGRPLRLLDVFVHQLPADVSRAAQLVRSLHAQRAGDRRYPFARVRLREGAEERGGCSQTRPRHVARRARQRHGDLEALQEPVLARRLHRRPARVSSVTRTSARATTRTPRT